MNQFDENTCRICLRTQSVLFCIFQRRKGVSPYEKLRKNTKLNIKTNDVGPSRICSECLLELDMTVTFLEKCEKSNQALSATWLQRQGEHFSCKLDSIYSSNAAHARLIEDSQDACLGISSEDFPMKVKDTMPLGDKRCPKCGSRQQCRHQASPKTHTCQQCNKIFNKKYNYQLHLKRHSGEREWSCPTCGLCQLTRWHAERHCAPRQRRLCPVPGCGKTFTTNTNLKTHIRVHSGERPYTCDDCGKSFRSRNTLSDHIRIHTGEKPYICPVCGKRFRTNKLTAHMCSHAERPVRPPPRPPPPALRTAHRHSCASCGARYAHKQSLNKHIKKNHNAQKSSNESGAEVK